ncbi:redox-sensitive transcriptional activator SoxR [Arthrobacter zhangbolii]|uniref:redox-sensitive transcriptional activator SoxR n=1 Tax=Arthrobacter zhangbolii TaxID=2886936 RepID=UPI00311AA624
MDTRAAGTPSGGPEPGGTSPEQRDHGDHGEAATDELTAGRSELSVGQVAQRSGVSVSALHFYERQGLLSSRRTQGNQRRFDRSVLRRVAVIRAAQQAGIPLAVISRAFGELPPDGVPDQADWQRLSAAWRQELDSRIRHLQALRDRLGGCIGCGCLSLAECRFVNPDDASADSGTGARAFDV